ncbi:excalibur calcium-binding domain-containing protein [Gynuella sunshinyii]|uniref:excalibur calcium-binding domain-containing protein n=1 Tax=Gynuella sunshinyii TaxID=1445505 RepID=UPI0005CC2AA7|nr:excalibur calcium-binding domain-containing protein [Gynuella sunshinyii]
MKKIFIVFILGFAGWSLYKDKFQNYSEFDSFASKQLWFNESTSRSSSNSNYTCDGRVYCSQMRSRAEAVFFIRNCPNTKMDGDRDGIPCENDSRF